jgi:Domain of unknown function (DUF4157)
LQLLQITARAGQLAALLVAGIALAGEGSSPLDPEAATEAPEGLPEDLQQAFLEHAAAALATAIRDSRRQALDRGVNPIPPQIRVALAPYFPATILDKARWTMAGGASLDGLLKDWFYLEGAVTLDEVIAFSDDMEAKDVELWAHELTHVIQYEELGIDAFASEYLRDFSSIERQASSNASRIMAGIDAAE